MPHPTFGKPGRCPACSSILPEPNADQLICPRCSVPLRAVQFPNAGLRFLIARPGNSLDAVLLELLETHDAGLAHSLRSALEDSDNDSLDTVELHAELLEELERRLPELADP